MTNSATGFAFPFRVDPQTGGLSWARGRDKVRQNIALILGTRQGERPMLREFGTKIPSLVHDPNDDILANTVRDQIHAALLRFEGRVLATTVTVERVEGEMRVRLNYVYVDEGMTDQIVFPLDGR